MDITPIFFFKFFNTVNDLPVLGHTGQLNAICQKKNTKIVLVIIKT